MTLPEGDKKLIDGAEHLGVQVRLYQIEKNFTDRAGAEQLFYGLLVECRTDSERWVSQQESGNLSSGKQTGLINKQNVYDEVKVRQFIRESLNSTPDKMFLSEDGAEQLIDMLSLPETYPAT
jgi:hypothetical protein